MLRFSDKKQFHRKFKEKCEIASFCDFYFGDTFPESNSTDATGRTRHGRDEPVPGSKLGPIFFKIARPGLTWNPVGFRLISPNYITHTWLFGLRLYKAELSFRRAPITKLKHPVQTNLVLVWSEYFNSYFKTLSGLSVKPFANTSVKL